MKEFTRDHYDVNFYGYPQATWENPADLNFDELTPYSAARGGGFAGVGAFLRSAVREQTDRTAVNVSVGARCARDR
jgi:hypothetical protein